MKLPSSVFGLGAENELRLVNSEGNQIQCLDNIEDPGCSQITRPVVMEIRDILSNGGRYASQEELSRRVKPELDTEQFELVSSIHHQVDALIHETEDTVGYLEHVLYTRYGNAVSLDQTVCVPSYPKYRPTTSTVLNKNFPHLVDNDSYQRYMKADELLTPKNVRPHTNILGRHTNISFTSKEIAETFFRSLNTKIQGILKNNFSTYTNTDKGRFESYKKVCHALGQTEMVLPPEKPIFDVDGCIPFSYHMVRFKEFSPGLYGVELRISDAVTESKAVQSRIEQELSLLFS